MLVYGTKLINFHKLITLRTKHFSLYFLKNSENRTTLHTVVTACIDLSRSVLSCLRGELVLEKSEHYSVNFMLGLQGTERHQNKISLRTFTVQSLIGLTNYVETYSVFLGYLQDRQTDAHDTPYMH
jgi:hypothetical protein